MMTSCVAQEETFRISGEPETLMLALHHRAPAGGIPVEEERVVLYVHGATFPSPLAIGYRFDGYSWMDHLSDAGFDVWGLDFPGYGNSDPYPEMSMPADANLPLGRASSAARQVARAVRFIRKQQGISRVNLIAHSWGTIVAALLATMEQALVGRLVLFGPIVRREQPMPSGESLAAYRFITLQDQWNRFIEDVPAGEPPALLRRHFDQWGPAYLATDSTSGEREPASVQTPSGPRADIYAAWNGDLAYDPAQLLTPTLIVRGEWDSLCTDADARWLFDALRNAPIRRDVKISRATHLMHLEESRYQLYRETRAFLEGCDTPETGR